MNTKDFFSKLQDIGSGMAQSAKNIAANVSRSAAQKTANSDAKASRYAAGRASAPKAPASRRSLMETGRRAIILLLVLVCFITVIAASCSAPADKSSDKDAANPKETITSVSPAL